MTFGEIQHSINNLPSDLRTVLSVHYTALAANTNPEGFKASILKAKLLR